MADAGPYIPCEDFLQFQEHLKSMRSIDDKIIYALNTSVPTKSFKGQINATDTCKSLYEDMSKSYSERDNAIRKCISEVSGHVRTCKAARDKDPDDLQAIKNLRNTQAKLRLMQSELNIEEVVKERSIKVFHEKCRNHFIPKTSAGAEL
ncbi:protein MIX23-like isoform X1 [Apostichopus japonicus]|uniref:protein MIX23-like isoform X1 n=2 Tax=Stichopus japonicus TaxID=307972 RepID=UPI003AB6220E